MRKIDHLANLEHELRRIQNVIDEDSELKLDFDRLRASYPKELKKYLREEKRRG